jgi:hypothetical protein
MKTQATIILAIAGAAVLVAAIYTASLTTQGSREVSTLETIRSTPYASKNGVTYVDEPLAHADLYLGQPVFAKELVVTIQFIPTNINALSVGVRQDSFWLSYPPYTVYTSDEEPADAASPLTATVTIPLTNKLQEPDQSADLMFFAEGEKPEWELISLTAQVRRAIPSVLQVLDYAYAIVSRERAL